MSRVRLSTTVDRDRLEACRRLTGTTDSALIDRALTALQDAFEADREQEALEALPYDADPELSWASPEGPDLPYDGEVPAEVRRLAAVRRRNRARS